MRLAGEVAAGEVGPEPLEPGTALGITTGAALPPGADAILRVEDATADGRRARPRRRCSPGSTSATRARTSRRGDVLAPAGARARRRSA